MGVLVQNEEYIGGVSQQFVDAVAQKQLISDKYSDESTYAVGDFCIYEDSLYVCNTAISTPEAWNSAHWDLTRVDEELKQVKSNLTELMDITQWNHESVSVTPTSADTTWYNTAVFNGLKTAKIVVLETGDLQAIFMNDGSNIKIKTFSFMYSSSNLSQYSTVIQLRVDFQNGKAGIRETYKASSGSYATLTDVYWI